MTEEQRVACAVCGRLALSETIAANHGRCMMCAIDAERAELGRLCRADGADGLFSVPASYLASRNADYRQHALLIAQAIAEVFAVHNLCTADLVARYRERPEHFHISLVDLDENGIAFARSGFQNWLKNIDRWKGTQTPTLAKYKQTLERQYLRFAKDR